MYIRVSQVDVTVSVACINLEICLSCLLQKPTAWGDTKHVEAKNPAAQAARRHNCYLEQKCKQAKQSWNEQCEPALECVTADHEKHPLSLLVVANFVKYQLTK